MSNVHTLLPKLVVNELLINDFIEADPPCFALGLVEERTRKRGFLALRPNEEIPPECTKHGFRFGHSLIGTSKFVVVQFAFEFYDFKTYNVLLNPSNPLVKTVLTTLVESGDYFFFVFSPSDSVTAFRSEMEVKDMVGLKTNFPQILSSRTTESQYQLALSAIRDNPSPAGPVVEWVCRDNPEYLDLDKYRMEMNPT